MTPSKTKSGKLKSAAIVKMKYQMLTGKMDEGFMTIYSGVLKDLSLKEEEVDQYIAEHQEELSQICLEGK